MWKRIGKRVQTGRDVKGASYVVQIVGKWRLWIVAIRVGVCTAGAIDMAVLDSEGPKEWCNILSGLYPQGCEQVVCCDQNSLSIREEHPFGQRIPEARALCDCPLDVLVCRAT